jgi:iron complex transport system substrate-binding protein
MRSEGRGQGRPSFWRWFVVLMLLGLVLGCGGCSQQGGSKGRTTAGTGAYSVTDEAGRTVHFTGKPQRIVSLTYGTDEILTALVDVQRLAAYSKWAGDPEITFITQAQAARVGHKLAENNVEAVVALQPDLIVLSTSSPEGVVKAFTDMGLRVYVAASPKTYAAMQKKITGLAAAVGEPEQGQKIAADMDQELAAIQKPLQQLQPEQERIVMAFSFIGAIGRQGQLLDEIFKLAHVKNGAAMAGLVQGAPLLSKEKIVAVDPQVMLLPTWNFETPENDVHKYADQIRHDPALQQVRAIKDNKLVFVSDRYRYVASQHVTDSVAAVAKAVYPELYQ